VAPPPKFNWQRAADLYVAGKTVREVADELGVSKDSVRAALRRLGVEIRARRPKPSRPAGTTLSRPAQNKRAAALEEAQTLVLEPPTEVDRCRYDSWDFGSGSPIKRPKCGAPTIAKGAKYCATHSGLGSDMGAGAGVAYGAEAIAYRLAEPVRVECARCGDAEEDVPSRESAEWFRQHRAACPAAIAAA
jgi:hypothetical protein